MLTGRVGARGVVVVLGLVGLGVACGGEPSPEEIAECSSGCKSAFRNDVTECDDGFFACGDGAQSADDVLSCNSNAKRCSINALNDATNCAEACPDDQLAQGYSCLRQPVEQFYQCQHVAFVEAFACTAEQSQCVDELRGKTQACQDTLGLASGACEP